MTNNPRLEYVLARRALNAHARSMGFKNARVWDGE